MLNAYKTPVILSIAKNLVFRPLKIMKIGFFTTLRMTDVEAFGIDK